MKPKRQRTNYSWDSSVFIAWLKAEPEAPLADIELVVKEIEATNANLIVSTILYTEVLETKHTQQQLDRFRLFLKRSNIVVCDVTLAIAEKARQIRDAGLSNDPQRKIRTIDAQIIATAILKRAHVLHSLDPHMLNLNASPVVDGLYITNPCELRGDMEQHSLLPPMP
jgi:predicted nucleic acid-binding protein